MFIRTDWGQVYDALESEPETAEQVRPIEAFYTNDGDTFKVKGWAHCNEQIEAWIPNCELA